MTGYDANQEDQQRTHATAWVPTTDIFVRGDDLVVRAELAGVEREDIEITITSGMLTISGSRKSDETDDISYYVRERFYGHFRRTMTLPESIAEEDIGATFENGMLEIVIKGGAASAKPRRIQVRPG
jgi:HSP20 family protein